MLYLVTTPIGNLEDMTMRAIRVLQEVDLIAAEDTRNSRKLLTHFEIHTPMTSYHQNNRFDKGRELTEMLVEGKNIAVITDAGMPGISDPGEELVRMALEAGVEVTAVPGACACVTALTISGLPTRRFCFEAFLPTEKKERARVLAELTDETRTIVMYEAPHRLAKTLAELAVTLGGERNVRILRELTKKHEDRYIGTLAEAAAHYEEEPAKGECVIVIEGADPAAAKRAEEASWSELDIAEHVAMYESQGMTRKDAMKAVAADRGIGKREVYQALLEGEDR
ncbi:MAG: 16S rRNA (cytidine(1402)-2'-O)-methyltransferase [Lachnospiraceae bacterium]|nr:16S rRNA (cytidine(1402)-2'-O)-methyltransferase [Lachnospiraceae bacterium]